MPWFFRAVRRLSVPAGVACLILAWPAAPAAHDIPNDVTVQAFVKPEGARLRLIVRVPLQAMRDMDYPKPRGATNSDLFDLGSADQTLRDAATLWVGDYLDLYENGERLGMPQVAAVRAALQSDRSFASWDEAAAHMTAPPLASDTEFFWSQGLLDVEFDYPIRSERSRFSINPRLARLGIRTLTVIRFLPPGGAVRSFEFYGEPGLVNLDPSWSQAVRQFLVLGFTYFAGGTDVLLFLVCLVMPIRQWRPLVAVVTSFAVAHSITLIASAYGLAPDALWFPPLIGALIAASVVYMALEDIVSAAKSQKTPQSTQSSGSKLLSANSAISAVPSSVDPGPVAPKLAHEMTSEGGLKRRWLATFAFGLAYGFGFSFALRPSLQFAGSHVPASVLSFNAGVELAQLFVLALLVPALALLFRYVVAERTGTIILSALAAHTAWHWTMDRLALLRRFRFEWPAVDAAFLAGAMRWMMLVVIASALYWLTFGVERTEGTEGTEGTDLHRETE